MLSKEKMSEFEDDDIDKMFEEMISSDELEVDMPKIDAIISIEQVSGPNVLKDLTFIYQSLSQSVIHVGELMLNFMAFEDYKLDDEVNDILGSMYKLSEDLDDYMIELLIEQSEIFKDEEDSEE